MWSLRLLEVQYSCHIPNLHVVEVNSTSTVHLLYWQRVGFFFCQKTWPYLGGGGGNFLKSVIPYRIWHRWVCQSSPFAPSAIIICWKLVNIWQKYIVSRARKQNKGKGTGETWECHPCLVWSFCRKSEQGLGNLICSQWMCSGTGLQQAYLRAQFPPFTTHALLWLFGKILKNKSKFNSHN